VHFELGENEVFDGTVVDDHITGTVTGCDSGSFELVRRDGQWSPYAFGP
jgi:hypothetical protein